MPAPRKLERCVQNKQRKIALTVFSPPILAGGRETWIRQNMVKVKIQSK